MSPFFMIIDVFLLFAAIGKTWNWVMENTVKALGISVTFVFMVWGTIVGYLLLVKALDHPGEFPLEKLGQVGDFFNVATSLASLITVVLVYSAYRLQKEELRQVSAQLEAQTNAAKDEEKINRAIKLFEEYVLISNIIDSSKEEDTKEKYKDLIYLTNRISGMKRSKIKKYIDFDVLEENIKAQGLPNHFKGATLTLNMKIGLTQGDVKRAKLRLEKFKKNHPFRPKDPEERKEYFALKKEIEQSVNSAEAREKKLSYDRKYVVKAFNEFKAEFPEEKLKKSTA